MTRTEAARLRGIARAAKLTPARRREIAKRGFQALVAKRFGEDRRRAIDWLVAKRAGRARRRLPASPAEVLRPRTDATGRTRRPGRPGVTILIHRTGPGPGGLTPPARRSGRRRRQCGSIRLGRCRRSCR